MYGQATLGLLNICFTSCDEFVRNYLCVSKSLIIDSSFNLVYLKRLVQQRTLLRIYNLLISAV